MRSRHHVIALLALCLGLLLPGSALATGSPDVTLAVNTDATVLYGTQSKVALQTTSPAGAPAGYNLSYRAVLPAGVSYATGSAGSTAGEPSIITGQPLTGQTTLIWKNVADLATNTTHTLNFKVVPSTTSITLGATYTINAGAYVSNDARWVPAFTATGQPDTTVAHPYTGSSDNKTGSTKVIGIQVDEDSTSAPGGELLRGVHDNQTIFTLTVKNNGVNFTGGVVVDDYLPPGVEFLGCGGANADHTTNAPTNPGSAEEYPGAGPISVPSLSGCTAPILVSVGTFDPTGPGPSALYTRVRWSLGAVPVGGTVTLKYRAAIPLRANTATWSGATPNTSGAQAANLDNNNGAEVANGTTLTNYANVSGTYNNSIPVSNDSSLTRTASDLRITKTPQTTGLAQGGTTLWDLVLNTSEYRDASNVTVTDTLPDGLCPLKNGATLTHGAPSSQDTAECASSGPTPTAPYTTADEQSDGSWNITWDASTDSALAQLAPSSSHTITFPTRTRSAYQEAYEDASPIAAADVVTNAAGAAGTGRLACTNGSACAPGPATGAEIGNGLTFATAVSDSTTATLTAATPTIDEKVATTSSDCTLASYTDGSPAPVYRPGDRICWLMHVDYPAGVDTAGGNVTDFLPSSLGFDSAFGTAGDQITGNDTIGAPSSFDTSTATPGPGGNLVWNLPSSSVHGANTFEHRVATRVQLPAGAAPGDTASNVLKASAATTSGFATPLRDDAPYALSMPVMSAQERIVAIDGNAQTPVATQTVNGGTLVTYRLRLTNATADTPAESVEAWAKLPAGVSCSDVAASGVAISDSGACASGIVTWGASPAIGPTVSQGSPKDLTYTVRVPTTIQPGQSMTTSSGIRQFQTTTNTGSAFTYVPASNVDPSQESSANVPAASASSTITGALPTITETRDTLLNEGSGPGDFNSNGTATIGETIRYTIVAKVPAGETIQNMTVTDAIDSRHLYTAGSLAMVQTGGGPTVAQPTISGGTISMPLGASYTAAPGADTVLTITFDTTVADLGTNFRQGTSLGNASSLAYTTPAGTTSTLGSGTIATAIVEPSVITDKTTDVGTTGVIGGQTINYTVSVRIGTGSTSAAHETTLVDAIPTTITPLNAAGNPASDGDSTLGGGVWNASARTITFTPPSTMYPGDVDSHTYRATVNTPAQAGTSIASAVTSTTTSLPGTVTGERTSTSTLHTGYLDTHTASITVATPTVVKSPIAKNLTPGEQVQYNVTVSIPANTVFYDGYVKDTVPDTMVFDSFITNTCTAGCGSGQTPFMQNYNVVSGSANTQVVAWDLGDVTTHSPNTRTLVLTYFAHLLANRRGTGTSIVRPMTSSGPVTVATDRTNKVGGFNALALPSPSGGFDDTSAASTSTVTVVEPILAIDKQVAVNAGAYASTMPIVHDGDVLHYRLVISNTGDNPAYDVSVRDVPNAGIRNVVPASGTSTTTNFDPWHAPGDDIGWQIPTAIAAGGSYTIDYTADLPVITSLHQNDILSNVATITGAFGLNGTYRSAHGFTYRNYSVTTIPSLTDTQSIKYDAPHITIDKTTGSGSGPGYPDFAGAEVGHSFTWRVTVKNTSSTAPATNLQIKDTLPKDWVYEPGASFTSGGPMEPTSMVSSASGDQLTWATAIPLAAGASTTLVYAAHPTRASVTSIGTGTAPANRHINWATAAVADAAGALGDGDALFVPPGGADTAYATLSIPSLSIAATPDGGAAKAGATVPWHVVITNTGSVSASNILITDTFPAGTTYVAGSATASPSTGFSAQTITATDGTFRIATLAGGASVDVTIPLKTDPAAASGTVLTNQASVTSDETGPAGNDNATVTLTPSADVAASKSAPIAATAGQSLQYTVGATNNGPSIAKDIVLTDTLPSTVTYVGSSSACTHTGATPDVVTCTFPGSTGVGAAVSATIDTLVKPGASGNANNTVHAAAAAASPDPTASNNDASVTVAVGAQADLSIVKTVAGATPDPHAGRAVNGRTTTFNLAVSNAGPSDAAGVAVTDTLPAGLTFVPGAGNSAGCTASGQVVTCPVGAMPASSTQTVTVVARANHVGAQLNTASVSSATTVEPNTANNTDTATVTVDPAADLTLAKTAPATVGAGDTLTYTLTATNHGPDDATGASIADTLPDGVVFDSADAGCTAAGQSVTCAVGAIANGASAVRHVTVRVPVVLGGQAITNNASVSATEADPDPANAASASTQVGPAADLSISQTGPKSVTAGGTLTYTLSIHNDGPSDAPDVDVIDSLPGGLSLNSTSRALGRSARDQRDAAAGRAGGSCGDASAGVVTCHLGTLTAGSSTLVTITLNTDKGNGGAHVVNAATVTTSIPELSGNNNASSLAVLIDPAPPEPDPPVVKNGDPAPAPPGSANLSISKVAQGVARANRELAYVITATNRGPSAADDVVVDDGLTGGVEYKAYRTSDGRCTYSGGTIHCKLGSLKVGEVAAVHVTVVPSKTGMLVNNATLSASTSDPDMSDNRAVATNTVSPLPPTTISIKQTTKAKKLRGGARVTYVIKVRNMGKNPASNVQACDRLPAQMSFTSTKGGVLNGSRLCFTTKLLAPGKSATYKVRVRVSARAKRGPLINRAFADAENAALQNASARVSVITDGKVSSEAVHGFTG
jgi:uncharacterized repeat protein (TIGR01451 family)/fimbrial isopeptide formation D2 family protein